jgi:hypothetical protein
VRFVNLELGAKVSSADGTGVKQATREIDLGHWDGRRGGGDGAQRDGADSRGNANSGELDMATLGAGTSIGCTSGFLTSLCCSGWYPRRRGGGDDGARCRRPARVSRRAGGAQRLGLVETEPQVAAATFK